MVTIRNYSAISPSAKALMLFKSHTQIPYAKQVCELLMGEGERKDTIDRDFGFWASVVHFENRYYSINKLVSEVKPSNILELSSGFNYRGLEFAKCKSDVHYIDADLDEIIELKKKIADTFHQTKLKGSLNYLTLNALNTESFMSTVHLLEDTALTIINEGLLVYLSKDEKCRLCNNIRTSLEKRGGYWVTSDIYLNHKPDQVGSDKDGKWSNFFNKMQVNNNMFSSFDEAEDFFFNNGFVLDKEYAPDYSSLTSSRHLIEVATPEQMDKLGKRGKVQATWRLKLK